MVLLGASGQIGNAMLRFLGAAETLDRSQMDLSITTHEDAYPRISSLDPSAIINCSAYTAVDRAEDEPELAERVNGTAVGILATVAADLNVPFVTHSTGYVFNGRGDRPYLESSPVDPVNTYGRTKLLGEHRAQEANPDTLIIRTSWVPRGPTPTRGHHAEVCQGRTPASGAAFKAGFIDLDQLRNIIEQTPQSSYREYLQRVLDETH